jgi:hypothetical protein
MVSLLLYFVTFLSFDEAKAIEPSFVGVAICGHGAQSALKQAEYDSLPFFRQIGIKSYGQMRVSWNVVEPQPPIEGVHSYDWSELDQDVKEIEAVGGSWHPEIASDAAWAVELDPETDATSSPPKGDSACAQENPNMGMSCWQAWEDFVGALVERYDHDGIDDMPGLKYAHPQWQIGMEYENTEQWNTLDGTQRAEKYVTLLQIAYEAAKQAYSDAIIISFSFNLGDAFDHNPTVEQFMEITDPQIVLRREFTAQVWQDGSDYFDLVGTNINYHYNGIPARIRWIRSYTNKPIWVDDSAPARLLCRTFVQPPLYDETVYPYKTETEIGEILLDKDHPEHAVLKAWWEKEKAKYTIKKVVMAASQGVESISFTFIFDLMGGNSNWGTVAEMAYIIGCGLLEGGRDVELRGTPKPVYYAMKLLNEKIGGFDTVSDANPLPEGIDPTDWTWQVRFTKANENAFVVWSEGAADSLDLSADFSTANVKVTPIITELNENSVPIYPDEKIVPANAVPANETPVFVQAFTPESPQTCQCELVPEKVTVLKGGSLPFYATVTNNMDEVQTVYFATRVGVPLDGRYIVQYPSEGYLRGPYRLTLEPFGTESADLILPIPDTAPYRIYRYIGYVGTPETGIYTCHFDFQVTIDQSGDLPGPPPALTIWK